jgi:hypothetical protein
MRIHNLPITPDNVLTFGARERRAMRLAVLLANDEDRQGARGQAAGTNAFTGFCRPVTEALRTNQQNYR